MMIMETVVRKNWLFINSSKIIFFIESTINFIYNLDIQILNTIIKIIIKKGGKI